MSSPLSRRAWLRTTSLGVGAGLVLPSALAAHTRLLGASDLEAYGRFIGSERSAAGPIRMNSNENPYGMSPKAKAAMMDAWDEHNRYGSGAYDVLRERFAAQVGVPADHVLVTQGSSEVLSTATLAFGMRGAEMMAANPTFETLPEFATHMGLTVHRVPLNSDHAHDLDAMDKRLVQAIGLVFVCNPNNPTGTLVANARVRDFVTSTAKRTTVLVDEAYHDYVTDPNYRSMTDLVTRGENVIVLRTASKIHGLAGCRIGFAIAHPDTLARMEGFASGFPNVLAARAAIAALADTEWQTFCKTKNEEGREILRTALTQLGRKQAASHTNFAFFHAGRPVAQVQAACLAKGYLVGRAFPPYTDWVRVSIGTPEEMRAFAKILPDVLRV